MCSSDLEAYDALDVLKQDTEEAARMAEGEEKARFYYEKVSRAMQNLRTPVDQLEMIVTKDMWPMPSYGDLMFEV